MAALNSYACQQLIKLDNTLETGLSPPISSSKDTPKMILGFKNLCHDKIFSFLLQSTYPGSSTFNIHSSKIKDLIQAEGQKQYIHLGQSSVERVISPIYGHALGLSVK